MRVERQPAERSGPREEAMRRVTAMLDDLQSALDVRREEVDADGWAPRLYDEPEPEDEEVESRAAAAAVTMDAPSATSAVGEGDARQLEPTPHAPPEPRGFRGGPAPRPTISSRAKVRHLPDWMYERLGETPRPDRASSSVVVRELSLDERIGDGAK